jgi:pimeloyl-ACP methyl ester carboxylesterase
MPRPALRSLVATTLVAGVAFPAGCSLPPRPSNPSFAISKVEARADLARMAQRPSTAQRPVVVLAGIGDPALSSGAMRSAVGPTIDGPVIEVHFFDEHTFEGARQKLLRSVADGLGSAPHALPEVDVVAFSMGGLVARYAAIPDEAGRRLRIRRLYTVCTPHLGARMAAFPLGTPQSEDMQITSDFMLALDRATRDYELVCYARLDDITVGEEFAAPPGEPLWWVGTPNGEWSHMHAFDDPRILADIARRLRNETPFSTLPAAPLPN